MLRVLTKQLAAVILTASLAGGAGADTLAEGALKFQEGSAAYLTKDYARALNEFLQAAKAGYANAQHNLGLMYYNGQGTSQTHAEA